jgi:hypothetical protein
MNSSQIVPISQKQDFVQNVQKWALLDVQLKKINEKTKEYRDYKHKLSESICTYLNENNLQNTKIEISNGEIKLYEKKEYSPLTFTYIEDCLAKLITDKSQVDFIIQYLRDNREVTTSPELRRTVKKGSDA